MTRLLDALRRFFPLIATAALATSSPGASRQHAPQAPRPMMASPALWMVRDDDTIIYLFGTVHMLPAHVRWFDDEVKAAFDRSDTLVLEVTEPEPAELAATVVPMAANTSGTPTRDMLSPDVRARYLAALGQYGIPAAQMDAVEPWLVAINLSTAPLMQFGYRQELGAEKVLTAAALKAGKSVEGLETVRQQLSYFDSMPQDVQVAYLKSTLDELPKVKTEFSELLKHWAQGNPKALAARMNDSIKEVPDLAKVLLHDRNANWVEWISRRMDRPGTLFVAVGAGHLAGTDSVISMLEARGMTVRRLSVKDFPPR